METNVFTTPKIISMEMRRCNLLSVLIFVLLSKTGIPYAEGQVGKRFASERWVFEDSVTKRQITAISATVFESEKIYQSHPSWTSDSNYIVFYSDRGAGRQAYAYSVETGEIIQLTAGPVNFKDPISLNLARLSNKMYYLKQGYIVELDLDAVFRDSQNNRAIGDEQYERKVGTFPSELDVPGRFTIDADEKSAYIETNWMQDTLKKWGIGKMDLRTGKLTMILELDFRLGHTAANPWVPSELLYCWETGGDSPQRMWLVNGDGTNNRPLYIETPDEWVTHEVWRDRDHVQFNLAAHTLPLRTKPTGIVAINIRNNEVKTYTNAEGSGYHHNTGTSDGKWAIADTFTGRLDLINLETGETVPLTVGHREGNRVHAHASISPDNKTVLFNSILLGKQNVMMLSIP